MLLMGLVPLAVVFAGWIVYPVALAVRARMRGVPAETRSNSGQSERWVDLIIATRESPPAIASQVQRLAAERADRFHIHIIVAVDPCSAHPLAEYQASLSGLDVQVVPGDRPGGKTATLNAGMRAGAAELVVLVDTAPVLEVGAVGGLAAALDQSEFGAISGVVTQDSGDRLMNLYWRYELTLRSAQAARHSIICALGQFYAIRRSLWIDLPSRLICDDLWVTFSVVMRGHRVGLCPSARAHDPRVFTRAQQFQRRLRTMTGLVQFCAWNPSVFLPWRNPIWIDFVMHKVVRIFTPILLIAGVALTIWAVVPHAGLMELSPADWATVLASGALIIGIAAGTSRGKALLRTAVWAGSLLVIPILALKNGVNKNWDVWQSHVPGLLSTPSSGSDRE
jgi:cellulose synthase/poly-beta-1,6-N-acetylglucosamine synthase-like glycosyltransferase